MGWDIGAVKFKPAGSRPVVAYWEDVLRKVMQSEEFRKAAVRQQWDAGFKGAAETRKVMEEEYAQTKNMMSYVGLVNWKSIT